MTDASIKRVIVLTGLIGASAARAVAQELNQLREVEVAAITDSPALKISPVSIDVTDISWRYPSFRKSKGEKKRAKSELYRKGWK